MVELPDKTPQHIRTGPEPVPAMVESRDATLVSTLMRISRATAARTSTSDLLSEIATCTGEAIESQLVFIRSVSQDGNSFVVQAAAGPGVLPVSGMLGTYTPITPAMQKTEPGDILAINITNDSVEPALVAAEGWSFQELGVDEVLIVPLFSGGEMVGRLDIGRTHSAPFDAPALAGALLIGSYTASALNEGRLATVTEESQVYKTVFGLHQSVEQLADTNTILQAVVELILREPGCDRCYAMLWNVDRSEFVPIAVAGLEPHMVEMLKLITLSPQVVPAFDRMLHSSRPLVVRDALNSTLLPQSLVRALGIQSAMIVPLRGRHHQTIGFLLLDHRDDQHEFGTHQITVMEGIAGHLATMIENAMLYEDAVSSSDSLSVINEIGIQLAMLTDEESLFRQLHHQISAVIDATYFALGLLTDDRQEITVRFAADRNYTVERSLFVPGKDAISRSISLGRGSLTGARDMNDPSQWGMNVEGGEASHSQMTVPISVGRDVIGAMTVQSPFRHAYGPKDLSLFSAIALHTGVALDNARLYRMVQERGDRRAAVLDEFLQRHEIERKELVEEIHDNTLQTLAACLFGLDRADELIEDPDRIEELSTQLHSVRDHLADNIDWLRKRIFQLRPATLDVLGLEPALREYLGFIEKDNALDAQLDIDLPARLEPEQETVVYRLVQEAIALILMQGAATATTIRIRGDERKIVLTVHDNAARQASSLGAQHEENPRQDVGMLALIERAELAGGEVRVARTVGGGSSVQISLPARASGPGKHGHQVNGRSH